MTPYPIADITLVRRLERAEGRGNARSSSCVRSSIRTAERRGSRSPARTLCSIAHVAGDTDIRARFVSAADGGRFRRIESFFRDRGAAVDHEVSPLADPATLLLLTGRNYKPIELTSAMFRSIAIDGASEEAPYKPYVPGLAGHRFPVPPKPSSGEGGSGAVAAALRVRRIDASEAEVWAQTTAEGWSEAGASDFMLAAARVNANAPDGHLFLAELDGRPIATGVLAIHGRVAHLAGASTIPSGRRHGAQLALLDARLRYASAHGCDLALMGAVPGSQSQRNAERHGFRIAYTRIKWRLADT